MTADQVREVIRTQTTNNFAATHDQRSRLEQALVPPQRISVIVRTVDGGPIPDQELDVWLVASERPSDGYRIVMRDDGLQFGLASCGFPADKSLVLNGWYGDLLSTFLSM